MKVIALGIVGLIVLTPSKSEGSESELKIIKDVSKVMEQIAGVSDIVSSSKKEREAEMLKALAKIEPLRKQQAELIKELEEMKQSKDPDIKKQREIIVELLRIEEQIAQIKRESIKRIYEIEDRRQQKIIKKIRAMRNQIYRKEMTKKIMQRLREHRRRTQSEIERRRRKRD